MSQLKVLIAISCLAFCACVAFLSLTIYRYRPAVDEVCQTVVENYFDRENLQSFQSSCEQARARFPKFMSAKATANLINDLLSRLKISHLFLYEPEENLQIWYHEAIDNGIRARDINGTPVVFEVLPMSGGARAGIQKGDQVISVGGREIHAATEIFGLSGDFMLNRRGHALVVAVRAEKFEEDDSIRMSRLNANTGLLRVKSFLGSDFDQVKLDAIMSQTLSFQELIVDLRGNIGGSFPAMLRLLSAFSCQRELVGRLLISNTHVTPELDLNDDLDTEAQLSQIASAQKILLWTRPERACYRNKLWIMVDHQTSSVSEIFADHILETHRGAVVGEVTAGQVVMAKWFSLNSFEGEAYSLSVPIANYQNFKLHELEDVGVRPQKNLFYTLPEALLGADSWVDEILKMRHKSFFSR